MPSGWGRVHEIPRRPPGCVSSRAELSHVLAVRGPFLFWVSSFFGCNRMTNFALGFDAIARPRIAVKVSNWFCDKASAALFFRNCLAITSHVFDVLVMRIPSQIGQVVVGFGAVRVVTPFHAIRTLSGKRQQHQTVNSLRDYSPAKVKVDFFVTPFVEALLQLALLSYLSARSVVAALLFVSKYFPFLSGEVAIKAGYRMRCICVHALILPKPTFLSSTVSAGETLWCSPHCVPVVASGNFDLFEEVAA